MMQHAPLIAAGIAANHCDALRPRGPAPVDVMTEFNRFGKKLAEILEPQLEKFLGRDGLEVKPAQAETLSDLELTMYLAPLAGNSLLRLGSSKHRLLISIEAKGILAELDRAFGGTGDIEEALPQAFPMSADLLSNQLEDVVVTAMRETPIGTCAFEALDRGPNYEELAQYDPSEDLVMLTMQVNEATAKPWKIMLILTSNALPSLFTRSAKGASSSAPNYEPADPLAMPFADVPLPVQATLVNMTLPLAKLAGLVPGDVIPVSVARNVPLRIGETVIARGTVGELDDQIAVQVNQAFS